MIFFGYPESPRSGADAIRAAAELISDASGVSAQTWQDLNVDGRLVVNDILEQIEQCDLAIFDLTYPNPNVLFEVGYAVARQKRIWLSVDTTVAGARQSWRELAILSQIGYTPYRNSQDLAKRFAEKNPLTELVPVYDSLLAPIAQNGNLRSDAVLYCGTFAPYEASNRLNSLLETRQRRGANIVMADPSETSSTPITWYTKQLSECGAVLVNFAGEFRELGTLFNNRHALIAGLGRGLDRKVLLLAEEGYAAPFDYGDLIQFYGTGEECVESARDWLDAVITDSSADSRSVPRRKVLASLQFGEHVAENERRELGDYFVETAAFYEVVRARDSIFIGHRGTGKTANALRAYDTVASNKTNLAVLIKPPGFEFPALLDVVSRLPEYQHDYFFDALWRFVIESEIAFEVVQRLDLRSASIPLSEDEEEFLKFVDEASFDVRGDVSVRLEQALDGLSTILERSEQDSASKRNFINEAFHNTALAKLRSQLGKILGDRKRVAVFVDNLDKGWEHGADFKTMARFILGLLTARGHVVTDFDKHDHWRRSIKVTVAVFLRSDIYTYLRKEAREPDKLPISTVKWEDWESLKTVIGERFLMSDIGETDSEILWTKYFCRTVNGIPLQEFLRAVTLPRPRDLVLLCNTAVGRALDRGHSTVLEEDFRQAVIEYSQYAYEALLVENGVTVPEMKEALLGFLDAPRIAGRAERNAALIYIGVPEGRIDAIIDKLVSMSFFGLEVSADEFIYPEVGTEMAVAAARAERLESDSERRRLEIHPAFHAFLNVID